MRRRLWVVRGREAHVPLGPGKRARRARAGTPQRSGTGRIADLFEDLVDGLLDFLTSWRP